MNKRSLIIGLTYAIVLAPALWAIGPRFTPQQMHEMATHVVTGGVDAIYERTAQKGDWKYTYYIAEISVNDSEKGEGVGRGVEIFVRYWSRRWIGNGPVPASGMGQRGKPAEGDSIRAYLERKAQNQNTLFKVVAEDGFEKLE
jgi:hypothetical protein